MSKYLIMPINVAHLHKNKKYKIIAYSEGIPENNVDLSGIDQIIIWLQDQFFDIDITHLPSIPLVYFLNHRLKNKNIITKETVIYFNADKKENFECIEELSQSGVNCGIFFEQNKSILWEEVQNLFNFYIDNIDILSQIQPFTYFLYSYRRGNMLDINDLYFNNPAKYIYMDMNGNFALSFQNLIDNNIIANNYNLPSDLSCLIKTHHQERIREIMMNKWECSSCKGFVFCQGFFLENRDTRFCKSFFTNIRIQLNGIIERKVNKIGNENNNF